MDRAIDHLEVCDNTTEGIKHRVEYQGLQRCVGVTLRSRDTLYHCPEYLLHAHAGPAGGAYYLLALTAQQVNYLVLHLLGHSVVHVTLVDHRHNLQVVVDSHIQIADSLRLHTLSGIHHQQRTLATGNTAAHLVGEVHMARGVDKVEHIMLATKVVVHLYGMALDGDTALTLKVHIVEHLVLRHVDSLGELQQTVSQR